MFPIVMLLFSRSVVSDSLRPHGLQHTRLPWPSLSPSLLKFMSIESVMPSNHLILCRPFLLLPHSFPTSGSFPMSQLFISGGQCIGDSASASVLPGLTGLISLQAKGLSSLLQHRNLKASVLQHSAFFMVQSSHPYMTTGKTSSDSTELFQQSDVFAF